MPNRLQPLDLMDFTGGLNLRKNQFQLDENESPDLLNVDIDPRGGFYTRKGWQRWNHDDIIDMEPAAAVWQPRNAFVITTADGEQFIYVVNDHKVYWAGNDGVFALYPTIICDATPHGADFVAWGNDVYIACGMFRPSFRDGSAGPIAMAPATWSEVETPTHNTMPHAEYAAAHASYLFVAVTDEVDGNHFSRVRWSHPDKPDSFRADDYLDIESGGGRITGLMSFRDHLLIFKTNSIWALYGYDEDSWQLIKVSISVGCPSITAATRSETAVYFFSASDRGGVYAYNGESPVYLSENMRTAFEDIHAFQNVFVSWAGRRLWVGVPWIKGQGGVDDLSTAFVFDPDIGEGAWTMYRSDHGAIGPVLDGSDVYAHYPLSAFWSSEVAIMVSVDYIDEAYDELFVAPVLGVTPPAQPDPAFLMTSAGQEIELTGVDLKGQSFDAYYKTRWLHAGWPDRKKSWRRPTLVCRQVDRDTELVVETFRDYDETTIHRTRILHVRAQGAAYWREAGFTTPEDGGFDWKELGKADPSGRGADWSSQKAGSQLVRSGSMGLARAVQMRVRVSPNTPLQKWGVDGIVAKYVPEEIPLMAKLDITYDILQDSPASASPVEANFNRIEQHINQEVIERGGTVSMVAQLQLAGDPQAPLDAAPKQYVDAIMPIGIIMMYGGIAAPPGGKWALCNGAELESALYPELFAVISTTYSLAGTPAGRFNLPNLIDRFAVGQGAIAALGKTGGSKDAIVPAHSHTIDHGHPAGVTGTETVNHTHAGVDHLHRVDLWSGGASARHAHGSEVGGGQFMTYGVGGSVKAGSGTSIPFVGPYATGVDNPDHTHAINGLSGAADRSLTTGTVSAYHQHQFTPTAMTGRSGTEGVAVTDTNLPPYLGVTYIIRIY